jgi:hypothetical protein
MHAQTVSPCSTGKASQIEAQRLRATLTIMLRLLRKLPPTSPDLEWCQETTPALQHMLFEAHQHRSARRPLPMPQSMETNRPKELEA